MNTFTADLSARKRILKHICATHKQWMPRMTLFAVLIIAALGICGYFTYILIHYPLTVEGALLFACTGVCFACVPFFVSLSVKNKAKYLCAFPFSSYANGTLVLHDQVLSYRFWRVGPNEPAAYSSKRAVYHDEDQFEFIISKSDIHSFEIKDDICRIEGNGKFNMPEWALEDDAVNSKIAKDFSFLLAFKEKDAAQRIKEWIK